jgi:hypothetical protein
MMGVTYMTGVDGNDEMMWQIVPQVKVVRRG